MLINKEQIKRVYALGANLGIIEHGNKNDDLHSLVFTLTQKESVSKLSTSDFKKVENELLRQLKLVNHKAPLKKKVTKPEKTERKAGAMTDKQISLAWRYIYRLMELDTKSTATAGERMCGAIKKNLDIDVTIKNPFVWLDYKQGSKLIEVLKKYTTSAEKKAVSA